MAFITASVPVKFKAPANRVVPPLPIPVAAILSWSLKNSSLTVEYGLAGGVKSDVQRATPLEIRISSM